MCARWCSVHHLSPACTLHPGPCAPPLPICLTLPDAPQKKLSGTFFRTKVGVGVAVLSFKRQSEAVWLGRGWAFGGDDHYDRTIQPSIMLFGGLGRLVWQMAVRYRIK